MEKFLKYKLSIAFSILGTFNLLILFVGFNWITFGFTIAMFVTAFGNYIEEKKK